MSEDCIWSDMIVLSLYGLFYDVLQEDFEIFIKLEDKLEPVLISGLDVNLHCLVTEWCNGSLIDVNLVRGLKICDFKLLRLRGLIFISIYDSIEFHKWISLNWRVVQVFKYCFFYLKSKFMLLLFHKSVFVFYW